MFVRPRRGGLPWTMSIHWPLTWVDAVPSGLAGRRCWPSRSTVTRATASALAAIVLMRRVCHKQRSFLKSPNEVGVSDAGPYADGSRDLGAHRGAGGGRSYSYGCVRQHVRERDPAAGLCEGR